MSTTTQFTRSPSGTIVHLVAAGTTFTRCNRSASFWPKWRSEDTLGRTGADVRTTSVCSKCRS